ncbi:MAG: nitroreductase family protein [Ramlibacter sp.]|jgi:nitroreductase|nr:nitroreductase family protein [Ramlibacter sp.]
MDAPAQMAAPADPPTAALNAAALIAHRQTILPKRLDEPGPDESQLDQIFRAAAAAPDHNERLPWRFVLIPASQRERLAQVFAASLRERDPLATAEQTVQAREKAFRSPTLMLAVVDSGPPDDEIPPPERYISAGGAIQNMLLMATAQGFGSALTSGKAMESKVLRELFALRDTEHAVCFVSIGTATRRKPARARPEPDRFVSTLGPE